MERCNICVHLTNIERQIELLWGPPKVLRGIYGKKSMLEVDFTVDFIEIVWFS